jgi:hypothetical protein
MADEKNREYYEARELCFETAQRMIFCDLIEPKAPTKQSKERYSATFLIDPASPIFSGEGKQTIQALSLLVAQEQFPVLYQDALKAAKEAGQFNRAGVIGALEAAGIQFPFITIAELNEERRKNGQKLYQDFGNPQLLHFSMRSNVDEKDRYRHRPKLGSVASGAGVIFGKEELAMHADKFYGGAYAFAVGRAAAHLVDGKRTVKFYLNQVFVTGRGERLGGNGGADRFDKFLGKDTAVNPIDSPAAPSGDVPDVI